jgi:hypothetical protein
MLLLDHALSFRARVRSLAGCYYARSLPYPCNKSEMARPGCPIDNDNPQAHLQTTSSAHPHYSVRNNHEGS